MNFISAFEVMRPNDGGTSSSHTAGAVSIGKMARKLFKEKVTEVTFTLYGSFARTYKGHGTDRALLGACLDLQPMICGQGCIFLGREDGSEISVYR